MVPARVEDRRAGSCGAFVEGFPLGGQNRRVVAVAFDKVADVHDELGPEKVQLRDRDIEATLYTEMLIPDLLADVGNLIESLHHLVEDIPHAMRFSRYSRLEPPEFLRSDGKELATAVGHAVDQLVQAARAFFRDFTHVRDFVHKVSFYESESDAVRDRLFEKIYATDLGLAEKDHIARAVRELDGVADRAERISDMLTIFAIKRSE